MKVFVSYSRRDKDFVLRLVKSLREAGVDLWLDQTDIPTGNRWDVEIEKALESSNTILLVISPESVSSQNVLDEVSYALEEQKRIIPVLYKESKIPFRLRRFQYTDFTGDFNAGLSNLLKNFAVSKANSHSPAQSIPETVSQINTSGLKADQIAQSLKRALNEGGDGNFVIIHVDHEKNYYLQVSAHKGDKVVYTEIVGTSFLAPDNQFSSAQLQFIKDLGWVENQGENFSRSFDVVSSDQFDLMINTITKALEKVFGISSEEEIRVELNLETLS